MIEIEYNTYSVCSAKHHSYICFINRSTCKQCFCYIGEIKNKNSILCLRDEYYKKYKKKKLFLTEKINLVR